MGTVIRTVTIRLGSLLIVMLLKQLFPVFLSAFIISHVLCDDEDDPEGRVKSTKVYF